MMHRYRTDYANQVHQLMVSVSRHYFITRDGKYRYQKKPFDVQFGARGSKRHVVHYMIRDHFSGLFYAELSDSESLIPIERFLYRAWSRKAAHPLHGIPDALTIPKTVQDVWPSLARAVADLGITVIKVTSGFQGGVRDLRTWEDYLRYGPYESGFPPDYAEVTAKAPDICRQLATAAFVGESKEHTWRTHLRDTDLLVPAVEAFLD